jgi:hypothetical protein
MKKLDLQLRKVVVEREEISNYFITPQWLVGFFEAEGTLVTTKNNKPRIEISQHASDYFLLKAIQKFVGGGNVRFDLRKSYCAVWTISDKQLISNKLLCLFDTFLVLQQKRELYNDWRRRHFITIQTKSTKDCIQINPQWLCGFVDGDGSFHGIVRKQNDYKSSFQVTVVFDLAQKDTSFTEEDFKRINLSFFEKKAVLSKVKNMYHLKIVSIKTHQNLVIPFFLKHKLQSRKHLDFLIYCEMCNLILSNSHLTAKGIHQFLLYRQKQQQLRVFVSLIIKRLFPPIHKSRA